MIRVCLLIPVYRHLTPLPAVLASLASYDLPCFLIDDCNDPPLQDALAADLAGRSWVHVVRLAAHGGKGAASLAGIRQALEQGFTHAICMDADAQHDSRDVPRILELARQHPEAMILGRPVFDHTAPAKRRFGRIVSNIWVWIETWSFDIKDSLCGFHCLPLKPIVEIDAKVRVERGMTFDPDIVVRLFWFGVPVVSFDTHVRYPADGISNFHLWRDNAALFRLHTRLFFGMLLRGGRP